MGGYKRDRARFSHKIERTIDMNCSCMDTRVHVALLMIASLPTKREPRILQPFSFSLPPPEEEAVSRGGELIFYSVSSSPSGQSRDDLSPCVVSNSTSARPNSFFSHEGQRTNLVLRVPTEISPL